MFPLDQAIRGQRSNWPPIRGVKAQESVSKKVRRSLATHTCDLSGMKPEPQLGRHMESQKRGFVTHCEGHR
jgi:hypothetical protein